MDHRLTPEPRRLSSRVTDTHLEGAWYAGTSRDRRCEGYEMVS